MAGLATIAESWRANDYDRLLVAVGDLIADLRSDPTPFAAVAAFTLEPGLAARRGQTRDGIRLLAEAESQATKMGLLTWSNVLRRRSGELTREDGGQRVMDEVDSWLSGQGVVRPARYVRIFAPQVSREEE